MATAFGSAKLDKAPEKKAHGLDMLDADEGMAAEHEGRISERGKFIRFALMGLKPSRHFARAQVGQKAARLKTDASGQVGEHRRTADILLGLEGSPKHGSVVGLEHASLARQLGTLERGPGI